MYDLKLLEKLTAEFHNANITDIRYYISSRESESISIYEGGSDGSAFSKQSIILAEGNVNGFLGSAYIEKLCENYFSEFVKSMQDTAKYNKNPYIKYDLSCEKNDIEEISFPNSENIISEMLETEKEIYDLNPKITHVTQFRCVKDKENVTLLSDDGEKLTSSSGYIFKGIGVVTDNGAVKKNAFKYKVSKSYDKNDFKSLAELAVSEAITLLDSQIPPSGNYSVIFANTVFAEVISVALPLFYGDSILKGITRFKDKEGQKIFDKNFSLTEDPISPNGRIFRTFDDEGIDTYNKNIVKNGVLETMLHNKYTAEALGTKSTGNGFRKSVRESVSVRSTNTFVSSGDKTLSGLIKTMNTGIVVNSVQGLHAGINTITGDISLLSSGYMIENGEIISGVEQITVAGNLFDMLNNISLLGNDMGSTSFSSMVDLAFVCAPSVFFEKLSIAGK